MFQCRSSRRGGHWVLLIACCAGAVAGCSDGSGKGTGAGPRRVATTRFLESGFFDLVKPLAHDAGLRTGAVNEGRVGGGATSDHHVRLQLREASPEKVDRLMRAVAGAMEKAVGTEASGPVTVFAVGREPEKLASGFTITYQTSGGTRGSVTARCDLGKQFAEPDQPGGRVIDAEAALGVLTIEQKEWLD